MFYQSQPSLDVYFRKKNTGTNSIKTHLHRFFELHCCVEGVLQLEIQGRKWIVPAGNAAIIFPYQPHNYTATGGKGYFFTFDPDLISLFSNRYTNMIPEKPVFSFDYDFGAISENSSVYSIKSFLYCMCDRVGKLQYIRTSAEGRVLLEKIFHVTEENYRNCDFSLERLSEILEYDYGYLSKYFLKTTGMKFVDYLNQRRVACAVYLLQGGHVGEICDAAYASGYSSIRSFNRNFRRIEGKTPREYAAFSKRSVN